MTILTNNDGTVQPSLIDISAHKIFKDVDDSLILDSIRSAGWRYQNAGCTDHALEQAHTDIAALMNASDPFNTGRCKGYVLDEDKLNAMLKGMQPVAVAIVQPAANQKTPPVITSIEALLTGAPQPLPEAPPVPPHELEQVITSSALDSNNGKQAKASKAKTKKVEESNTDPINANDKTDSAQAKSKSNRGKPKISTQILNSAIASKDIFWRSPKGVGYVTLSINGHYENHRISSDEYRHMLSLRHYNHIGATPSKTDLDNVVMMLEGEARIRGKQYEPKLRVAESDGKVYIDLCNSSWQVVELDEHGWRVIRDSPVKFVRSGDMLPLPDPSNAGPEALTELCSLFNFADKHSQILFLGFIISSYRPHGPYFTLSINGSQGTAKTTILRAARKLTDPNDCPDRAEPKNIEDVITAAQFNHVCSWDNLSHLDNWLSDGLSRLNTGGSIGGRAFYKQGVEATFKACRPVIINGISALVARDDLLERSLMPRLQPIPKTERKTEEQFWNEFNTIYPHALGALFNAISGAIKQLPHVKPVELPRMADPYKWCLAAAKDLGFTMEEFEQAYELNRADTAQISLESSPLAMYISTTMPLPWTGTATELLNQAKLARPDDYKTLPQLPRTVRDALVRQQEALKFNGIIITWLKPEKHRRLIRITRSEDHGINASEQKPAAGHYSDPWAEVLAGWVVGHAAGFTFMDVYTALNLSAARLDTKLHARLKQVLKELDYAQAGEKWYPSAWAALL